MGRRTIENRNIRNLQKTAGGSTYIVSLPIEIIRELKWRRKQKLVVKRYGDGILIKDWKPE
ncbi:MAG: AbrB/MazE/SpoVT family DNA-binding domain-containing protein [Bacteroidetes bacterium]|nr:AbrB/MazE/SpoVT family DNA-binding domain-containing protein [Bacteroidota bacterium]